MRMSPHFLTQIDYEEALMDQQIQEAGVEEVVYLTDDQKGYNLRSKSAGPKSPVAAPAKSKEDSALTRSKEAAANQPPALEKPTSPSAKQQKKQIQPPAKEQVSLKAPSHEVKVSDRPSLPFNFESEIQKVKIPMPLTELMKNEAFKAVILKSLEPKSSPSDDFVNLQDDKPKVTIGPMIEDRDDSCPPFYISLNVHDKILHNCLLDSGASHNLMPKAVMDELGLEVTKPYQDLFSFDSRKVRCLGLIKDMVINLAQLPMRSMVMDVVVADIPPKFGLLLSRSWGKRLGGTLQMDLSYAMIPVFGGEMKRLYRENQLAYIISDGKNSVNHPIYAVDTDFGSCILQIDDGQSAPMQLVKPIEQQAEGEDISVWTMYFDGASTRDSAGAGVVLISPTKETISLSFKLDFRTTNNIAEYEALLLGLNAAKELGIKGLKVLGDADLIVQQVNNTFQAKHVRLKAYRDEVWKLRDSFSVFEISYIPRDLNQLADSLAVSASTFVPPMPPKLSYEIQIKYRPSLPDNVKYWKVFEDDDELSRFLQVVDEFSDLHIDQQNLNEEELQKPELKKKLGQHDIVQLPNNYIPRGLVPLERLFDQNDVPYQPDKKEKDPAVQEHNIGGKSQPKFINLSSELTADEKSKYCSVLKEFSDVFAWKYSDLKTYDPDIIQHKIPLEKDTIPFKQKLRPISPLLLPVIEREIKKLLDAKIIVPLRYSKWIANLVIVRKKNGEVRLCVDFRNLNKCSKKDNYPLPKMEHLLQRISGAKVMSFLDGFSGYNQVVVHPDDQEKTAFTTPWGTFMYSKMPFGLMNVGATFQRAMDIAFVGEKDKFVLIYLDDITVYSSNHEEHLKHLKRVFLKCRQFGISLNPKKSQFALRKGKLLGHIVSAEGVMIDPARVEAIQKLSLPRSKKDIQSLLGKINFVRRFVPNFAELVKHITCMLKKGAEVKWTDSAKNSFQDIKKAIIESPILISPDYSKTFYIFSFASYDTVAAVLLQKDEEDFDHPVAFFSRTLRDAELRYDPIDKQAYALIKALKAFRIYILHSKVIAYVPSSSVKDVLTQPDIDGKRARWIAKMIEFNIEVKPTKLVKGQGLAKLLAEENRKLLDINFIAEISENSQADLAADGQHDSQQVAGHLSTCEWYAGIIHFLQKLEVPPELSLTQARALKLRAIKFCIYNNLLYWRDPAGLLLRCLDKEEAVEVTYQFHSADCGGHHYWKTTAHKILRAGYYWPFLFADVCSFVKSCDKCQRFTGKQQLKSLPLRPIVVNGPFQQWGLDFIGEINPASSGQHKWILVATDYFTKWIEAVPTRNATHQVVIKFLYENILSRFGCPKRLVADNAAVFKSEALMDMCESMGIQLVHSTPYYPQGNGLAESSNKSLIKIIRKLLEENKKSWDSKLKFSLWADRVTTKKSIGTSPFKLVYGTDAIFPVQLVLPVAKFFQEEQTEQNDMVRRMLDLVELQQAREQLVDRSEAHQMQIKKTFDRKAKEDSFQIGDWVLKWDALRQEKGKHGKFDSLWTGPFMITQVQNNNTFILQNLEGDEVFGGPVNGRFLKLYFI
jgi:ribonuclease HI